jgi:site-specific recombinase XerD
MSTTKNRRLLDEVRDVMRLLHYSIHTERSYCEWIKRFVHFHEMKSRDDLADGKRKIEMLLTHVAVPGHIAPATQNQAMNALVFFYRKVLKQDPSEQINAVRAYKKRSIPVVLTREETAKILSLMTGTPQLVAKRTWASECAGRSRV